MSIQDEISRIISLRDELRSKLVELSVLTDSAADLDKCVEAINAVAYKGDIDSVISSKGDVISIPAGYHNGGGTVSIAAVEKAKLIGSNIRAGVSVLGTTGTFTGDATATSAEILEGKTAYVNGQKVTGEIPTVQMSDLRLMLGIESGSVTADVSCDAGYLPEYAERVESLDLPTVNGKTVTPTTEDITAVDMYRYTLGDIVVKGDENLKSKNIRAGVAIFGTLGTFSAGDALSPLDSPAVSAEILSGKEAYDENGSVITGAMPDLRGNSVLGLTGGISSVESDGVNYVLRHTGYIDEPTVCFPISYIVTGVLDGNFDLLSYILSTGKNPYLAVGHTMLGGNVTGTFTSDADAVSSDIADGKIAYVNGNKVTGSLKTQTKIVTPTTSLQNIHPDNGYHSLSSVVVNAIPSNYKDISSVTAKAENVLSGKVFVDSDGKTVAGTMTNRGNYTATLDGLSEDLVTIPAGYHAGGGAVKLSKSIENALAAI